MARNKTVRIGLKKKSLKSVSRRNQVKKMKGGGGSNKKSKDSKKAMKGKKRKSKKSLRGMKRRMSLGSRALVGRKGLRGGSTSEPSPLKTLIDTIFTYNLPKDTSRVTWYDFVQNMYDNYFKNSYLFIYDDTTKSYKLSLPGGEGEEKYEFEIYSVESSIKIKLNEEELSLEADDFADFLEQYKLVNASFKKRDKQIFEANQETLFEYYERVVEKIITYRTNAPGNKTVLESIKKFSLELCSALIIAEIDERFESTETQLNSLFNLCYYFMVYHELNLIPVVDRDIQSKIYQIVYKIRSLIEYNIGPVIDIQGSDKKIATEQQKTIRLLNSLNSYYND